MELAPLDLVLLGGAALLVGIGLFRGLSGELASFAGLVAAVAVTLVTKAPSPDVEALFDRASAPAED